MYKVWAKLFTKTFAHILYIGKVFIKSNNFYISQVPGNILKLLAGSQIIRFYYIYGFNNFEINYVN